VASAHSPLSTPELNRVETPILAVAGLSRGPAPFGSRSGPAKPSDFPLSRGIAHSAALELGTKDRVIFWILVAIVHALSILPDFILYPLGVAGGWLAFHLDKRHARIGIRNLEIAFPERTDSERRQILLESYQNLGRTAGGVHPARRIFLSPARAPGHLQSGRHLERAQKKYPGKGALILTAHFGNFELLPAGHALHGFQISLVHHTQRFVAGDALMTFIRERAGVQIIRKHKAAREMLRTLIRGDLIGIPFDQKREALRGGPGCRSSAEVGGNAGGIRSPRDDRGLCRGAGVYRACSPTDGAI